MTLYKPARSVRVMRIDGASCRDDAGADGKRSGSLHGRHAPRRAIIRTCGSRFVRPMRPPPRKPERQVSTAITQDLTPPAIGPAVPRDLCTDCGISRTSEPARCGTACQFIHADYYALETQVHGRTRDASRGDELFFGPYRRMLRARMAEPDASSSMASASCVGQRNSTCTRSWKI